MSVGVLEKERKEEERERARRGGHGERGEDKDGYRVNKVFSFRLYPSTTSL